MSHHRRVVAQDLRNLADDIATRDRPIAGVRWYAHGDGDLLERAPRAYVPAVPIVPRAIHDALCPAIAVLLDDVPNAVMMCDRCFLAVEAGVQ